MAFQHSQKLMLGISEVFVGRIKGGGLHQEPNRLLPSRIGLLAIGELESEFGGIAQPHKSAAVVDLDWGGKLAGPSHASILTDIVGGRGQPAGAVPIRCGHSKGHRVA